MTDEHALEKVIETKYSCTTLSAENKARFVVFAQSHMVASEIARQLCADKVVSKQFGKVDAYWEDTRHQQISFLGKGIADLILTKENLISAFDATKAYGYMPVVGYPKYSAYFIGKSEKPKLEKLYFLDKRIGLIEYPTSRSGHILPKVLFNELDLNIDSLDITFAPSHSALKSLLARGELDVIASYWQESDKERFSRNYITAIDTDIPGTHWYLKLPSMNTELACASANIILRFAREQGSAYYRNAYSMWQCDDNEQRFMGDTHGAS